MCLELLVRLNPLRLIAKWWHDSLENCSFISILYFWRWSNCLCLGLQSSFSVFQMVESSWIFEQILTVSLTNLLMFRLAFVESTCWLTDCSLRLVPLTFHLDRVLDRSLMVIKDLNLRIIFAHWDARVLLQGVRFVRQDYVHGAARLSPICCLRFVELRWRLTLLVYNH